MHLKSLKDLDIGGKTVIVRCGFDVPVKNGVVQDDFRIVSAVPTINYLVSKKARLIIIAHLGRPEGWQADLSLLPVALLLAQILGRKFLALEPGQPRLPQYDVPHLYFLPHDLTRDGAASVLGQLREKDIAVLENLRFYPGEKSNDPEFVKLLASLGQAYVNEAFSNSHRRDASMTELPRLLPAAAGLDLEAETRAFSLLLDSPKKPFVVMMGGVKLADKAPALSSLSRAADFILIGGGLANLFLKASGFQIGKSVWDEKGEMPVAKQLLRDHRGKLKLPLDVVVSAAVDGPAEVVKPEKVKPSQMILDVGPKTILEYSRILKTGKTLLWSGAMGYFENPTFSHGTFALARLFASRSRGFAYGVAGGGETVEVIQKLKLAEYIDHLSTGGGALLEFLGGKSLPALEALEK